MSKYQYLTEINSPKDLKKLPEEAMPTLASEIRDFIISSVRKNGGHLASNLGTVELTLAMHRVFNSPHDHFIFDVGHQTYAHKILTGRREAFDSLRKPGGLSGFTKRSESEHDPFGAGHSSTSLSAALGFACADRINGSDAYTVAVIGDGAYTGGMIHEALNNCGKNMRLIIILNENEMSISKNIGGFARQMAKIRSRKSYYKVKDATRSVLDHIPLVGHAVFAMVRDTKQSIKNAMYDSNYFEDIGLYYIGPVNGNDYFALADLLQVAKGLDRSCVIHVTTRKGKGYRPAEAMPSDYHSVEPESAEKKDENFSLVAGKYLCKMAGRDERICAVTAAMTKGTGLTRFASEYPSRFFDVGIAEEHGATFCAGLAANGMKPFFAVYSSFLQRAYDNVIHDVALQSLPVTFLIDRAGLSEGDGATHHGIFDVSFLSGVPGMTLYAPVTADTLRLAMDECAASETPCAVRYANCCENEEIAAHFYPDGAPEKLGVRADFTGDASTVVVTYGNIVCEALKAQKEIENCGIILLEKLRPYPETAKALSDLIPAAVKNVVFLEEGIKNGGASMILADKLHEDERFAPAKLRILAVDDQFVFGEKGKTMPQSAHISAEDIVNAVNIN